MYASSAMTIIYIFFSVATGDAGGDVSDVADDGGKRRQGRKKKSKKVKGKKRPIYRVRLGPIMTPIAYWLPVREKIKVKAGCSNGCL